MHEPILNIDFSPYTYFQKSLYFVRQNCQSEALQAIDTAILFSNSTPFYIYQKVKLLFNLGMLEACSQFILTQFRYFSRNASLYLLCRLIDYYQKINHLDNHELAELLTSCKVPFCLSTEYQHLLEDPHYNLMPLINKAMFQDKYTLCLSYCEVLLKTRHPRNEFYFLKGYFHHMLRDLVEARTYYKHYISLEPKDSMVYDHLGQVYMEEGLYLNALEAFHIAGMYQPNEKSYKMHLAECYYVCRQYDACAHVYEELSALFPDDLQIAFNLSCLYKKHNKKYLYRKYYKKTKKLAMCLA